MAIFVPLARKFLRENSYYGPMGIEPTDLVKAYGVFRSTDYFGNHDNNEGHNFERDQTMRTVMGANDVSRGDIYFVWTVVAEEFDDYLKKLLREEIGGK
jgi:hypothetical protein